MDPTTFTIGKFALLTFLTCIGTRDDPFLVGLAAVICCIGAAAALRLFDQAENSRSHVRIAWIFVASLVAGGSIWCTHFVAILAFNPGVSVAYDPVTTMVSLIASIVGINLGLSLAAICRRRAMIVAGGVIVGLSIAAMHYIGMLAYRLDGVVHWRPGVAIASIMLAVALSVGAIVAARDGGRRRRWASPLLILAVLALHFIGMAALNITPLGHVRALPDRSVTALALASAMVGLLVIAAGTFARLIDQSGRADSRAKLRHMALTDADSGLPNGRAFVAALDARLAMIRPGDGLMLITLRLAAYENIVERFGSQTADRVLHAIIMRLHAVKLSHAQIGRNGRSEFAAFAAWTGQATDQTDVRAYAARIVEVLSAPVLIDLVEIDVDPRLGLAGYPADATTREELVRCSHMALSRALGEPLEPVAIYQADEAASTSRRRRLAGDLRGALDRGEFCLYYQPQVWIEDRSIIGYEALLRWHHPELGLISPLEFIPLAEQTGLIVPIGGWALRKACQVAAAWPVASRVAVNMSPLQLRQHDLPEMVHDALVRSGLSPDRLEIELTESLLVDDRVRALHVLRRIRALGVRLSLDDFGTGYSSLDVLRQIPFDKIKLDKSFVEDLESNPQSRAILHAIIALAKSLDIPALVEGVETEHQLAFLRAAGCKKVQGYLTGRPVPDEELVHRVHAGWQISA